MSDEKVRQLVSAIFDPKHRATRAFVSAAIHTLLHEARRAGRAEAFEIAAALASGDPRDSWEQQAMADHLRTLAAKEREG